MKKIGNNGTIWNLTRNIIIKSIIIITKIFIIFWKILFDTSEDLCKIVSRLINKVLSELLFVLLFDELVITKKKKKKKK